MSVKIKNNYDSAIGFGSVCALPGEVTELPTNYPANHPTLANYVARGWVEVVGGNKAVKPDQHSGDLTETGEDSDEGNGSAASPAEKPKRASSKSSEV